MKWTKASERMPRAKAHVKWRWAVTLVEVEYAFVRELFKGHNDHKTKFEWLDESESPTPGAYTKDDMAIALLKERRKERSLIVYILEITLLDEGELSEDYKICMKDEIENHNCFIQEYTDELKLLEPSSDNETPKI